MPYINIKITDEKVTARQKQQLIEGATLLLEQVLNKPRSTTYVVIDEINTDNWAWAARPSPRCALKRGRHHPRCDSRRSSYIMTYAPPVVKDTEQL